MRYLLFDHKRFLWPRKRGRRYYSGAVSGLVLALGYGVTAAAPPPSPDTAVLTAQEQQLQQVEAQVGALAQQLRDQTARRDQLYRELERSEREIAVSTRLSRELDTRLALQQQRSAQLQRQHAAIHTVWQQTHDQLARLVRAAYVMGRGDRLRLVLNQEDPSRSGRLFGYYYCVSRARTQQVALLARQTQALTALQQDTATAATRMTTLLQRQQTTRQQLATAQQRQRHVVALLEQTIDYGEERVANLYKNIHHLRAIITALRRQGDIRAELDFQQDTFVTRKGQLAWPVTPVQLRSRFRTEQTTNLHSDGVLLAAPAGTEVHAVHAGQIVFADWLRGFGLLIVVAHDDGYMTLYGHNQTLLKEPGEWVASADVIALVGDSGGYLDAGLYFALRHRGEALDPQQWCRAAPQPAAVPDTGQRASSSDN